MKVLHLLTKTSGGAANGAAAIIEAITNFEIDNSIAYVEGPEPDTHSVRLSHPKSFPQSQLTRLQFSLAKKWRPKGLEAFTPAQIGSQTKLSYDLIQEYDIVHMHWLGDRAFDLETLYDSIPDTIPIIITLHDLNPITAGCHYPDGCNGHENGCLKCPQLPGWFGQQICKKSYQIKMNIYSRRNVHLVATSQWSYQLASVSALGKCAQSISRIPNPTEAPSRPSYRKEARSRLGLVASEKIILFGAHNTNNKRKGLHLLKKALSEPELRDCKVISFGSPTGWQHPQLEELGYISNKSQLRHYYVAANVFCLPSTEEAFGLTGTESLCEGTPVVCFENTGPCDYVIHGKTGYTASNTTPLALAKTLQRCINDPKVQNPQHIKESYLKLYQNELSKDACGGKYQALYSKLTEPY